MSSSTPRPNSQKQVPDVEAYSASYTACWNAFKDTEARLKHRDAEYMQLSDENMQLLDANRRLRDEKKLLMDRIQELEAIRKKYEPTARPEAYPRVQNMSAADRAVFTHAVLGAHHGPRRNSAPSAAEHPDTRRESSSLARTPAEPRAAQVPQERNGPPPPPPSERRHVHMAGPAPKPIALPPPPADKGKAASPATAPAPKVIRIEEYQPSDASTGLPKRKFVQVDPTLPPQKRNRPSGTDVSSRTQAPVWSVPPLQTHMAPSLSPTNQRQHASPVSPPVGPYGHAPPMPTHSAERSTVMAEADRTRLHASRHGSNMRTTNGDPAQRES